MKKLLASLILLSGSLFAQELPEFRVYLNDKGSSIKLLESPEKFLSEAALNRRALQGISICKSDLPLAPEYKQSLQNLGAEILAQSKWLNYCYVRHASPELIASLPFVKRVEFPKAHKSMLCNVAADSLDYGFAGGQVRMLEGDKLHLRGYTGTGITIAVIDAGFDGFYQASTFDSLRLSGRLLGTYNFINADTNVFSGNGSHGTSVLSTMAALEPDVMIGSAPHANYWLLSSEDIVQENPIEMDHWIMAAEFADSVGAHVINTSLSYTTFDDSQFNLSYSDLDGNTVPITIAADLAAQKGILVMVSAGNLGADPWHHIGAPGDADSVLTVGAVSFMGDFASFSSYGPSADGRVKPDVLAQGSPTTIVNGMGAIDIDFGTSYASPIVAGLAACLIEAYPAKHSAEIADMIRKSAHLFATPNDSMGYGIPNFDLAYTLSQSEILWQENTLSIYPNPVRDYLIIDAQNQKNWQSTARLYDLNGRLVYSKEISAYDAYRLHLNLQAGWYQLQLDGDLMGNFKLYIH